MFGLVAIYFVEHTQRFAIKCEVCVVDAIREFPGSGIQIDYFGVCFGCDVGDEVVLFPGGRVDLEAG